MLSCIKKDIPHSASVFQCYGTLLLFLILSFVSTAQNQSHYVFKRTDYFPDGKSYTRLDTIKKKAGEKIDIRFFTFHFGTPHELPVSFSDTLNKNKRLEIWDKPYEPKDLEANWNNSFTYDKEGRLISFGYSGCSTCPKKEYNYTLLYNMDGRLEQIVNTLGRHEMYSFIYDQNGDIRSFTKHAGELEIDIELIK